VGAAFQIADDLLDYSGDPQVTGKSRCSDLRDGKMTLPLIAAYKKLPQGSSSQRLIDDIIADNLPLTNDGLDKVVDIIGQHGGFDYAKRRAHDLVCDAKTALDRCLQASVFRTALEKIADYSISRDR